MMDLNNFIGLSPFYGLIVACSGFPVKKKREKTIKLKRKHPVLKNNESLLIYVSFV